jgi:hypothetical protein
VQTRRSLSSFSISSATPAHQVALRRDAVEVWSARLTLTLDLTPHPDPRADPSPLFCTHYINKTL